MKKFHEHVWFDRIVLFLILLNCLVMALEEPGLDKNSKVGSLVLVILVLVMMVVMLIYGKVVSG